MSERLFFALWPDRPCAQSWPAALPRLLAGADGRPQRPDQWHVTLEFLGEVAAEHLPALRQAAGLARLEPLVIEFDRVEHWPRPRVACLRRHARAGRARVRGRPFARCAGSGWLRDRRAPVPPARDAGAQGPRGGRDDAGGTDPVAGATASRWCGR